MLKTLRYRLYPSKSQTRLLERTLEACRCWYNQCLAERRDAYRERGERIGKFQQLAQVKLLKASSSAAADIHSHVLQRVVSDLDMAFQGFFQRQKAGQTPGFPRFKSRKRFHSFGFKEYGNGFKVDGRRLRLSGIGRVAVRWHRPLEGQIKTLRVSYQAGGWYACFTCEVEAALLPATGQEIGVAFGNDSITTSDDEKIAYPDSYLVAQRRLQILQRRVARRKQGSTNWQEAEEQLERHRETITNQRTDYLNKLAHWLISNYDRIALEDYTSLRNNDDGARSILDSGWGYLKQHLMRKAAEAGRVVYLVEPQSTSHQHSANERPRAEDERAGHDRCSDPACANQCDKARTMLTRAGQAHWGLSLPGGRLPQGAARPSPQRSVRKM